MAVEAPQDRDPIGRHHRAFEQQHRIGQRGEQAEQPRAMIGGRIIGAAPPLRVDRIERAPVPRTVEKRGRRARRIGPSMWQLRRGRGGQLPPPSAQLAQRRMGRMERTQATWLERLSTDSASRSHPISAKLACKPAKAMNSLVQTGVKSAGWENSTSQRPR